MSEAKAVTIRLWDLPVRLFHWAVVVLIAGLWATHAFGKMDVHIKLGLALLFLVVFRVVWGFLGSDTARFTSFVKGPAGILAYLRSGRSADGGPVVGHNPLGALSVLGLIGLMAVQVGLGLFATDTDAIYSGPLNYWVDAELAEKLTDLHELGFKLIELMVVIHLGAIIFYAVKKKERLVPPMVTGKKTYDEPVAQPKGAPWWRLVLALALAGTATWWVAQGGHFVPPPPMPAGLEDYG
jgi:cytochrome b